MIIDSLVLSCEMEKEMAVENGNRFLRVNKNKFAPATTTKTTPLSLRPFGHKILAR